MSKQNTLGDIFSTDTGRSERRRVGRGLGSGLGKTGGRGGKGEGSRTGGKNRGPMFEGGQKPFWMRLPKRGFSNAVHKAVFQPIPLSRALLRVKGNEISLETLAKAGLVKSGVRVKLVGGRGEDAEAKCDRKVAVSVHRVTGSVRAAIEKAGGTVVELDLQSEQPAK